MILTVGDLIGHAAAKNPAKEAIFYKENTMRYDEVHDQSFHLAQTLLSLGVEKGDRICFYLEKRFEKVVSIFGISLAGGVFVPIRRLSVTSQAVHILNNCEASILITTSSRLSALKGSLHNLKAVIVIDSFDSIVADCRTVSWTQAISPSQQRQSLPQVVAQDIAAILYTSGSTGQPKGVVLSHQNIVAGAQIVSEYLQITEDDRLLSILTFGFDYGLNQLMSSVLHSAQLVLFDYLFPKDILNIVHDYRITGLPAVSATWIQLLQIPWNEKMSSLRYVTNSGGAIPVELVKELRRRIPETDVYLMYGLTEAFRSTYLEPSMVDLRPSSMGKAVPGEQILILDENNLPVKAGEIGELVHRGVLVAQGYWGEEELTTQRYRKNPLQLPSVPLKETVVYSGDYVKIDAEGYLFFQGRRDEMIKSAGNRISPTEIEDILYASDLVADAVAMGIPHEIYGQVILVVVSLLDEKQTSSSDIRSYCQKNMPQFMIPAEIIIWGELPRNTNGKLDRAKIKAQITSEEMDDSGL